MIHTTLRSNVGFSRIFVTAILLLLAVPLRTIAGVAVGSIPTNAAEAEQRRLILFNDAELSLQRKLEVGKERYKQRQVDRAKAIEAMSAELTARQKVVVFQPAAASYVNKEDADTSSWLLLGVAALGVGFLSLRYYRSRQNR
jgi:hypothetical protein